MSNAEKSPRSPGITRRTVVKGAAWSAPAILLATAAPRATASTDPGASCPTIDRSSVVVTGSGEFVPRSNGNNGWLSAGTYGSQNVTVQPIVDPQNPTLDPRIYQFMRDGGETPGGPTGVNQLTITLPVVQGTTYQIVTPLRTGRGDSAQTWRSEVEMHIDGVQQWAGTTKSGFTAPTLPVGAPFDQRNYGRYSPTATYVATETKNITITITLTTLARATNTAAYGDDIWVTLPTVLCS